jgi:hypothetical protein
MHSRLLLSVVSYVLIRKHAHVSDTLNICKKQRTTKIMNIQMRKGGRKNYDGGGEFNQL